MKTRRFRLSACLFLFVLFSAGLNSDADAAGVSNIIRILQISVGLDISPDAGDDANGDKKISMEDAVHILQIAAGLRDDDTWKYNLGTINLLGTSITYSGSGIAVSGTTATITAGGDYTITGTLTDGMIVVNTAEKAKLRLSGVNITNSSGPAIFISNADKAFITITDGTENYLADGTAYSIEAKGTLFSNDTLEIKGSGTLHISGNYKHAIACDDDITIENGTIIIEKSVKDGIHANNKISIEGGNIAITSTSDGIESEGNIVVKAGTITVSAGGGGLVAATDLTISGGILAAAGSANSTPSDSSTQYSVLLTSAAADSVIRIQQDTTEILTFKAAKAYQSILFSSPKLQAGKEYVVYTGGSTEGGTDFYGLYDTGTTTYSGGTASANFTTASVITIVNGSAGTTRRK